MKGRLYIYIVSTIIGVSVVCYSILNKVLT